jgi:hypothetical protein
VNWRKVVLYSTALFVVGFASGFAESSFAPSGVRLLASAAASFVFCGAIFAHLAAHQPSRPFVHAWAALLLQVTVGSVLTRVLMSWPVDTHLLLIAFDQFVLMCALAIGTMLGINLRDRARQSADA